LTAGHTANAHSPAFLLLASLVVLSAGATITRRNPVAAVMWLVATFFGLAAVYALLYAHFLSALPVLLYAGAIIVLFILVVMVLTRDEPELFAWKSLWLRGPIALIGLGYFGYRLIFHFQSLNSRPVADPPADFGTVAQVGHVLFTDYLFVFEAVSVL